MKLSFVHLGNGITVYSTEVTIDNDYPTLAHISAERVISYSKTGKIKLRKTDIKEIERFASRENPNISATQDNKVFSTFVDNTYYWTKKLGSKHYPAHHQTLCGIPMLGNNYYRERPDAPLCNKCKELKGKGE